MIHLILLEAELASSRPKVEKRASTKTDKYYGPDGEEYELGAKRRSGSFMVSIKSQTSLLDDFI